VAPSPDGRIVAYSDSYHGGGEDFSSIRAMTPAGRKADLGFSVAVGTHQFEPAWSPSGRKLAYAALDADALVDYFAQRLGVTGIYVAGSDASSPRRIARPRAYGATLNDPAWSADGQWISFTYDDGNGRTDIWLVQADGGALRHVTSGKADDRHSAWLQPVP
jgi:Tol biopolymer transport system component